LDTLKICLELKFKKVKINSDIKCNRQIDLVDGIFERWNQNITMFLTLVKILSVRKKLPWWLIWFMVIIYIYIYKYTS